MTEHTFGTADVQHHKSKILTFDRGQGYSLGIYTVYPVYMV